MRSHRADAERDRIRRSRAKPCVCCRRSRFRISLKSAVCATRRCPAESQPFGRRCGPAAGERWRWERRVAMTPEWRNVTGRPAVRHCGGGVAPPDEFRPAMMFAVLHGARGPADVGYTDGRWLPTRRLPRTSTARADAPRMRVGAYASRRKPISLTRRRRRRSQPALEHAARDRDQQLRLK